MAGRRMALTALSTVNDGANNFTVVTTAIKKVEPLMVT